MQLEHLSQCQVQTLHVVRQPTWARKPIGFWSSQGQWEQLESISNEADGYVMYTWKCVMQIAASDICSFPWKLEGGNGLIRVDMSDEDQLDTFINRFRAKDKARDVDWARVQEVFAGVIFTNVAFMPKHVWRRHNDSDGCWAISLTVDSVCIWDPNVIKSHKWTKRTKNVFVNTQL
jgi:hypothetical protein